MPKFGELLPADVWAAVTRTLTAITGTPRTNLVGSDAALWSHATRELTNIDIENVFDLPDLTTGYSGVGISSGAGVGLFGAWTQLVANVGAGKRLLYVMINQESVTNVAWECEIGVGALGAEARITAVSGRMIWTGGQQLAGSRVESLFASLADSARLSARIKDSDGAAINYSINWELA